jgi:ubiquinone/menaquinone biosynthesis C-methylase UbiE
MPFNQDVQAFDDRAATYESGRHGRLHQEISDRVVALAVARVPAPDRVLDVGSGTGYALRQLAARLPGAGAFLGIDAAPRMVEVARRGTNDPRVTFAHGVAEKLPADDGAYDLVVSTTSFDHWTSQDAGIRECTRVLRPGGTLVLTDQFAQFLWPMLRSRLGGKACTRALATSLIANAGLTQVEWHPCYAQIIQTVTALKPTSRTA